MVTQDPLARAQAGHEQASASSPTPAGATAGALLRILGSVAACPVVADD